MTQTKNTDLIIGGIAVVEQVSISTVYNGTSSIDCYFKRLPESTTERLVFENQGIGATLVIDCPDIVRVTLSRSGEVITSVFGYTDTERFYCDTSELSCNTLQAALTGMLYVLLQKTAGDAI